MDLVWRGVEVDGLERLRIDQGSSIQIHSVIDSARGRYSYEIECERDWTFRTLHLESAGDELAVDLESDGHGSWTHNGLLRDDLAECVDIDLSASPFTNSLPLRRHPLDIGDEEDFVMAFVEFTDLTVFPDAQRYQRLDEDLYRFESLDSDFTRDLTVDFDGFVVEYPGLFERL